MDLKIEKRQVNGVTIVSCQGRIMFGDEANALRDFLKEALAETPRMVLNLAQVPYMDSSAIAVLVEALQKIRKIGGRIFLTDLQPRVKGLLEIARLDSIFVVAKDEADALSRQ